ncbi:hypothetical protein Pan44_25760 [Caulifigura coniformis]|uniref:Uncharacterized protein n=1 Tax=Caulifigura coniformis TaxID=2527983 RepID=A0A517SEI6_9PLAN|nr:hypothetical protein [Caulifigura coniformis]QDT54543.1 hypothetical protein Pan44_25760 [Caulifigura coniformis]
MRWTRRVSDADVVEGVRRFERNRRTIAAFLVGTGLLVVTGAVVVGLWFHRGWKSAEIAPSVDDMTFFIGLTLGSTLSGSLVAGSHCVGHGIGMMIWRDRRNELLLSLWPSHDLKGKR